MSTRATDAPDPLAGRRLGQFVVTSKLGEGGFGAVYLADQPALARQAVIKVLHRRHRRARDLVERFLQEAKLASRLEHPYAAHVYDFGAEPDGLLWIAMERVQGVPLNDLVRAQGPLSPERLAPLLEKIAEVVHSAHELGIVHRDLKAANVMVVAKAGRLLPKLLDFGIAKSAAGEPDELGASDPAPLLAPAEAPALVVAETAAAIAPAELVSARTAAAISSAELVAAHTAALDPASGAASGSGGASSRPVVLSNPAGLAHAPQVIARQGSGPVVVSRAGAEASRPGGTNGSSAGGGSNGSSASGRGSGRVPSPSVFGSPPYMPPEQWRDSTTVDARADLYALGVLTYELLAGRLPFQAATLAGMREAHELQPVPPLPDGLPSALDGVLARAMAKRADARFPTALEYAAAFRAAAGLDAERAEVPRLDGAIAELYTTSAPRPLAEAVAALGAAPGVHQARDAAAELLRVLVRTLGLLALAGRSRLGPTSGDWRPVADALRALRRGALLDAHWLELARELVRPFARTPDLFPLPELVGLFFDPERGEPGEPGEPGERGEPGGRARPLEALLSSAPEAAGRAGTSEEQVRAELASRLPAVSAALQATSFLCAYDLVVQRGGRAERWMGVRAPHATFAPTRGAAPPDGRPLLLDASGHPALSLWPLAQVAAPSAGAADELFLLEGEGRRGARLVAWPARFERHDDALWTELGALVPDRAEPGAPEAPDERSPYPGLRAFGPDDAARFFGREREAEELRNRLLTTTLLAVVGPSGVGKSSFVQAGVVAELPAGWRTITLRPGPAPLAALAARLAQLGLPTGDLAGAVRRDPRVLGERLRAATPPGQLLLLVIDQLEELFTLCEDDRERRAFAEALALAARAPEEPVRVVLTLRDDFLARADELPALRRRLAQGMQLLGTPAPEELARIVIEPARRAGVELEDRALVDEMVRDVAAQPSALALLSFTAARLWERRDRQFRQLTRRAYAELGGVGGALAQHAEQTLATLSAGDQRLVRETFRHLVTAAGTRAVLSRAELGQLLGDAGRADAVVERLVAARLLVATEGEAAGDRIEVAHEALFTAWPRLVEWRREDREGARLRDQLRAAARQWDERGRPRGLLWRDEALAELTRWRRRHGAALTAAEEAFAAASLADAARGRRRVRGAVSAALVALAAGVVVQTATERRATRSAAEARGRLAELYEEQGRQLVLRGDPLRGLVYLDTALRAGRSGPGLRQMVAGATGRLDLQLQSFEGHRGQISAMDLDPERRRVVTASYDGTARVWDADSGRELRRLDHPAPLWWTELSPDGRSLLTTSWDGSARVWDVSSGRLLRTVFHSTGILLSAHFSPDGRALLTAGEDGIARTWELASGRLLATLPAGDLRLFARYSPDGRRVVSVGDRGLLKVWDAASGRLLRTLAGHHGPVYTQVRFSPDGATIASASADHTARIWDLASGRLLRTLDHPKTVNLARFSPDGTRLVTTCDDGGVRVWDVKSGEQLSIYLREQRPSVFAAFDPTGTRVASGSDAGTAAVWDARTGEPIARLVGHRSKVLMLSFDRTGDELLTSSHDGTVKRWRLRDSDQVARLRGHDGDVWTVRYSPDGRRLLTSGQDGTFRQWDAGSGRPLSSLRPDGGPASWSAWSPDGARLVSLRADVATLADGATGAPSARLVGHRGRILRAAFSPDGATLVTAGDDRTARLWDARTGARRATFVGHAGPVWGAAISPDGRLVATGSEDHTARLWDAASGREVARLAGHGLWVNAVAFSDDGTRLLTASDDRTARVWSVPDGRPLRLLEGHSDEMYAAAFSADGARAATATRNGELFVWDVTTGRQVASLDGQDGNSYGLAFSPDGSRLASVGFYGQVRLWDVHLDRRDAAAVARYCRCHLPFELRGGQLLGRALEPAACEDKNLTIR